MDGSYARMLDTVWQSKNTVWKNLQNVRDNIDHWKFASFDQTRNKKKELVARIGGIQRRVHAGNKTRGLVSLENKLQQELDTILKKEELMWFQRSRVHWLKDGDRNTKYYQMKAVTRRRKNNVLMLKGENGQWVDNVNQIRSMATDFYQKLFTMNQLHGDWYQTDVTYPRLSSEALGELSSPITNDEVRRAMFHMNPWKAPGLDGFLAGFYQKSWSIVGRKVCDFVKEVWTNPSIISEVNQTNICLIPKIQQPEYISQFRPISLCNTIYKVVSKVVVERLKEFIPVIISPYQTGFVPGRNIHENIIVAQEMTHSMVKMKGSKGLVAIKVDLSKAYDKLKWDFIWQILKEIQLPDSLINVIMHSITSVETNVKWNGARGSYFRPQRGIRQGDPISPYLFVMCIDKLSHLISQAVKEGTWKAPRAGRNGPIVSHLMFAYDLLLFGEATTEQLKCMTDILDKFCRLLGQQVSNEKTSVFSSSNTSRRLRDTLIRTSGYRETNSFGKYLGGSFNRESPKKEGF
jgi:hypothetical protein